MGEICGRSKTYPKTKEVYRVENPDKPREGCHYSTTSKWHHLPNPYQDGLGYIKERVEVCGTVSKRQFKLWWCRKLLKAEEANGKKTLIMQVPTRSLKVGKHQCVFPRSHAKVIGELLPNGRSFYYLRQKG